MKRMAETQKQTMFQTFQLFLSQQSETSFRLFALLCFYDHHTSLIRFWQVCSVVCSPLTWWDTDLNLRILRICTLHSGYSKRHKMTLRAYFPRDHSWTHGCSDNFLYKIQQICMYLRANLYLENNLSVCVPRWLCFASIKSGRKEFQPRTHFALASG